MDLDGEGHGNEAGGVTPSDETSLLGRQVENMEVNWDIAWFSEVLYEGSWQPLAGSRSKARQTTLLALNQAEAVDALTEKEKAAYVNMVESGVGSSESTSGLVAERNHLRVNVISVAQVSGTRLPESTSRKDLLVVVLTILAVLFCLFVVVYLFQRGLILCFGDARPCVD